MSLLSVKNVSKAYREYKSEWRRFFSWFGLGFKPVRETWVLRNINFSIDHGETVGIVGQNGAGKSTLLKIITGTTQPTEGEVLFNGRGRVAAILELGMGFNPELTGRQNVYHSAGLMGFSYSEIHAVMPQIEVFAEIGKYFDEPVRTYSSGMQVRVAFAVATAYRPDVLIIDEALSVGDSYFQHKSFARISQFQEQGTTLLIVSHDPGAIKVLCNRAILVEKGTIIKDGVPEEIFDFYNAIIAEKENSTVDVNKKGNGVTQTRSGTGEARVTQILLCNSKGEATNFVEVGEEVVLRITVLVNEAVDTLVLGYGIKDRLGQIMFGTNTWYTKQVIENPMPGEVIDFSISFHANLGVGSYSIQTALVDKNTHLTANYEWVDLALVFNIINVGKTEFVGLLWCEPTIFVERNN